MKKPIEAFTDSYLEENQLEGMMADLFRETALEDDAARYDTFFQFFLDEQFEPGAAQQLARTFVAKIGERESRRTSH